MFITFEGTEGCGKSTQIKLLNKFLIDKGFDVVLTREPGGTAIADKIRSILVDAQHTEMVSLCEVLLYYASRAQHIEEIILPALKQNKIVLCDRFNDSSIAYQGYARGVDQDLLKKLSQLVLNDLKPHITFVLVLPVEEGLKRAKARASKLSIEKREDRFENEILDFHHKVRGGFLDMAKKEPDRFKLIDASRDVNEIHDDIAKIVEEYLKNTTHNTLSTIHE